MICGREEASTIPTLLVAPRTSTARANSGQDAGGDGDQEGVDRGIYENGVGDSRGWYEDGAYTAAPTSPPSSVSGASDTELSCGRDAQDVYYESLLGRFEMLRHTLAQVPPRHAVERLGPDHGSYMSASAKDYKMWRWRLRNTEPKPAQLAGIDKETVLRLLRMVGDRKGGFLGVDTLVGEGGGEARRRVSAWIWGLLARLPDRGQLVSEEVGIVRDLGKRAVWVGVEMKGVDMGGLQAQVEDGGEEEEGGDEEVVDVDVDVDGEDEQLELEEDDSCITNGDDRISGNQHHNSSSPDSRNSSSFLDPDAPPIIGPISPEPLRGQSSRHFNSTSKGDNPDTLTAEEQEQEEAQALGAARARLLARLGSHTAQPASASRDNGADEEARTRQEDGAGSEDEEWSEDNGVAGNGKEEDDEGEYDGHGEAGREGKGGGERMSGIQAAKILLDMIITIAGEVYGQRDLLEFREVWE